MFRIVATKDPTAVEVEVQKSYLTVFPRGNQLFVPQMFGWAIDCFTGNYADYQPIDAQYHDFEHTLQGTLCMARLLCGRHLAGAQPAVTERLFQLGIVAILLHDTGYLKHKGDHHGTGAKYTVIHVRRSAEFAEELLARKRYAAADIKAVQNMILCTGIDAALEAIPFQSEEERIVGFALGTADLLGQMAAPDYVDKLPVLFAEFEEAARHEHGRNKSVGMFSSAAGLRQKTPEFWDNYVKPKLEKDFLGLQRFLADPKSPGRNPYLEMIEKNIDRLRGELAESPMAQR
jgi:hypothetical protein